jgi:hypothetical protein
VIYTWLSLKSFFYKMNVHTNKVYIWIVTKLDLYFRVRYLGKYRFSYKRILIMLKQGQSRNYITKGIFEPLRRPFPFSFGSVLYFLAEDLGVGKFLRWKWNKIIFNFNFSYERGHLDCELYSLKLKSLINNYTTIPNWKTWTYMGPSI